MHRSFANFASKIWYGTALTLAIAAFALAFPVVSGLRFPGPIVIALLVGIALRAALGLWHSTEYGIRFAGRSLLRFAVVLLGFQITLHQVLELGGAGLFVVCISLLTTFVFAVYAAKWLQIEARFAELIASGTAICGASAILATRSVNDAREEDATYAVAAITIVGSVLMIVMPLLANSVGLDTQSFGVWIGSSLHEVAQVVGAGFQVGTETGQSSVITKLARVMLLAPILAAMAWQFSRHEERSASRHRVKAPLPWFVVGFFTAVVANSLGLTPAFLSGFAKDVFTLLLTMAMAALGLNTDFSKLRAQGLRPFVLCLLSTIFLLIVSFVLIKLVL